MRHRTTLELWQKGNCCLAKIPELDFIAQGRTSEEAKANLMEVVKIQFQEMGTLDDYLSECGFELKGDTIEPAPELIGFEKQTIQ
jgi:hypothetical protein